MLALWLLVCCVFVSASADRSNLDVLYEWKYFDMVWQSEDQKSAAISSGDYNYTKMVSIDVDKWQKKVFVTIIRNEGVPSSLNTVSDKSGPGGPLLQPYPDWSWTKKGDCNGITSVYRVAIDECDRLWVLDTGRIGDDRPCPAQLLAFDLHTDKLIKRVKIPDDVAMNSDEDGLLITPIVETRGRACQRTTVYIADVEGSGLVIYNGTNTWRIDSDIFGYDPSATKFTILKESFILEDGVLGMAISPPDEPNKKLYFRSLSSLDMNSANLVDLRNSHFNKNVRFDRSRKILPSQAPAMAMSSKGILFFVLTTETALTCWNTHKPLLRQNMAIVARDLTKLQFGSGIKVKNSEHGETVLISTNRLQKIYDRTMNYNECNFRILQANVKSLVANTICE